jgi:quinoprotein glucose dehydrogenase
MARSAKALYSTAAGFLIAVALGLVSTSVSESTRTYVPGDQATNWPTADGVGGTHYSPLADITRETVRYLEVAWTYRTGDVHTHEDGMAGTAFEATPIVVDGVLFVATPYSRAIALDAETGSELWTFDPEIDRSDREHTMVTSRGLSYWKDPTRTPGHECASRIVLASYDARLFTLDAATGLPCSDFAGGEGVDLGVGIDRIEGRRHQFKHTAPPTVVGDAIVVGSTIYDSHHADAPSGAVRAFDVRTGELRWSWEPLVGEGAAAETGEWVPAGAANTWATITADEQRDLVFVPTGSPSPDHYGGLRPGDNGYANSLVALQASTGQVVWHYQTVRHDLWDYDLPSPPALVTIERNGETVPAVVQSTKMGYLFVLHRETGEPIFPVADVPVPASDVPGERTSPTQPVPVLPRPLVSQGLAPEDAWGITPFDRAACARRIALLRSDGAYAPPSLRGTVVFPGFIGGMEWGGVAFDPESQLLVTNTNRVAMVATLIPRNEAQAALPADEDAKFSLAMQDRTPYAVKREPLLSPLGVPCNGPPWGMLHGLDMRTGRVAWEVPLGQMTDVVKAPTPRRWGSPNLGGPLISGGLVFIAATMDRRLRAFDLETGEMVWETDLPASAQASPMTYRARPGGRQYVVIAAGGHDGLRSRLGDHVVAFALPAPEREAR